MSDLDDLFLFIIDTTTHAGNFERELCAHCTGQVGDCGVGEEHAAQFRKDHPELVDVFAAIIGSAPDDHGNERPVRIWKTPGYWNDGMGTVWKDEDWGKPETVTTYREAIKNWGHYSEDLDPINGMPGRHPAYQSVAILFGEQPTPEQLLFLKERALKWVPRKMYDEAIEFTGFRLIQEVRSEKLLWRFGQADGLPVNEERENCPACLYGDCFNPRHQ